jgi:hypothetical protein
MEALLSWDDIKALGIEQDDSKAGDDDVVEDDVVCGCLIGARGMGNEGRKVLVDKLEEEEEATGVFSSPPFFIRVLCIPRIENASISLIKGSLSWIRFMFWLSKDDPSALMTAL